MRDTVDVSGGEDQPAPKAEGWCRQRTRSPDRLIVHIIQFPQVSRPADFAPLSSASRPA